MTRQQPGTAPVYNLGIDSREDASNNGHGAASFSCAAQV